MMDNIDTNANGMKEMKRNKNKDKTKWRPYTEKPNNGKYEEKTKSKN